MRPSLPDLAPATSGGSAPAAGAHQPLLESAACNLCGGDRRRVLFQAKDRQYRTVPEPVWCGVARCRSCGHAYLCPRVREDRIGEFYPSKEYYTYRQTTPAAGWKQAVMRELFLRVAERSFGYPPLLERRPAALPEWLLRILTPIAFRLMRFRFRRLVPFTAGGRLLDFGFGSGDYLLRMRELGWECWGVERHPADAGALEARGIEVCERLDDPRIPRGSFDWVTADHVLEHVYDPRTVLAAMAGALRPGGRVYIGVPNFSSLSARLFRSCWYNLSVPIHPHQYTPATLRRFLSAAGFDNIRMVKRSLAQDLLASLDIALNALRGRFTGRKHTSFRLRDSRLLGLLALPAVKALDLLGLGDRIEAVAEKQAP